jgi:hypothetical protein
MTVAKHNRRKFAVYAAVVVLAFLVLRIPAVQYIIAEALIEFIHITERTLRLPCALLNHDHCFSLDRLDPTCPQCM